MSRSPSWSLGRRLLASQRPLAVGAASLALLAAVLLGVRPILTTTLIHAAVTVPDQSSAWRAAALLVATAVTGVIVGCGSQVTLSVLTERVLRDLRIGVFGYELSESSTDAASLARVVNDASVAAQLLAGVVPMAAGAILNATAVTLALIVVDARVLAAVTVAIAAVFIPLTLRYRRIATSTMAELLHSYEVMTEDLGEAAAGAAIAWRFGRPDLAARFRPSNEAMGRSYVAVFSLAARYGGSIAAMRGLAYAVAVVATVEFVPSVERVAVLAGFLVALPTVFAAVELISQIVDSTTIGSAALARLADLDLHWSEPAPTNPCHLPSHSTIEMSNLQRSFDGFRLGPLTLKIGSGTTAIVGATGAGKTTLARQLAGLDEPTEGSVTIDGLETHTARQHGLVVMLPQNPQLFPGTVSANLALARPGIGPVELNDFVRHIGLGEWLDHLPAALLTVVDETLSEGDRQLVSLLQILLRDPAVVILDEPTASLDALTSARVERAAAQVFAGRTIVIVTHNLATAQHADRILVLDDGDIVGDGGHEALLETCARYRELRGPASEGQSRT